MNITITMHCSTVTVAVAYHQPCHANKENLDRWREEDKVQQRTQERRGDWGDRGTEIRLESGGAEAHTTKV